MEKIANSKGPKISHMDNAPPPLVSIIIPAHNSASWIRETIDNVLSQSYPCCEIIIIDDGSTDNTKCIIDEHYSEHVKYSYQENSGPARARNRGVELATGEYIQFLDSDDFLSPNKIARQMAAFMENPICDVVYCDFAYTTDGPEGEIEDSPDTFKAKCGTENVFASLLKGNFIVIHSPLTRTDVIRICGAFDTTLSSDEDYDLWLRVAGKGYRFCFVPEVLAFYRRRDNSISTNLFKQGIGTLQALNKAKSYRAKLTGEERSNLGYNLSREHGWRSRRHLEQGHYSKTLSSLLQSVVHKPRHGMTVASNLLKQIIEQFLNRHLLWRLRKK